MELTFECTGVIVYGPVGNVQLLPDLVHRKTLLTEFNNARVITSGEASISFSMKYFLQKIFFKLSRVRALRDSLARCAKNWSRGRCTART